MGIKCLIMLCWGGGCLCSLPNIAQKSLWYGREKKKCVKFGSVVVVHSASIYIRADFLGSVMLNRDHQIKDQGRLEYDISGHM